MSGEAPVSVTPTGNPAIAIPVVTNPGHNGHRPRAEVQCGRVIPAYDTVQRMQVIEDALGQHPAVRWLPPQPQPTLTSAIRRVHDDDLVDFLASAWNSHLCPDDDLELIFADTFLHPGLHAPGHTSTKPEDAGAFGRYCFDTITGIGPDTFDAAVGSVASALTAASHALAGNPLTVALSRPPGHHVSTNAFGGGCYLNNAAISAQWLRDQGASKVAIVDIDFHHGNGTQAIFYERPDVLYTSLHGHPRRCYPYFTGYPDETGAGVGRGATVNIPLDEGVEGPAYLTGLDQALTTVSAHNPEVVVVSLGFDTYSTDPAGDALLETGDYFAIGQAFRELGTPLLAILEGGYSTRDLGANTYAWVNGATAGRNRSTRS